jgi:hypothetical protein
MRQWTRVLTFISRPDNEQLKNEHPAALGLGLGDEIHQPCSFTAPAGDTMHDI